MIMDRITKEELNAIIREISFFMSEPMYVNLQAIMESRVRYDAIYIDESVLTQLVCTDNSYVYIKTCLEVPLDRVPLYLNESGLSKTIFNHRLKLGK